MHATFLHQQSWHAACKRASWRYWVQVQACMLTWHLPCLPQVLMPPPFSTHHNQYLQRYKKTGLWLPTALCASAQQC